MQKLLLLPDAEQALRIDKIKSGLSKAASGSYGLLVTSNANLFYTTGRVFSGYVYISSGAETVYLVKRPVELAGDNVIYIRKPEQIAEVLAKAGIEVPDTLFLELDQLSYSAAERLRNAFGASVLTNGSAAIRAARDIKTEMDIRSRKD